MSFNGENHGSVLNYGPGVSFWARLVLKQDLKYTGRNFSLDYKLVTHTVIPYDTKNTVYYTV